MIVVCSVLLVGCATTVGPGDAGRGAALFEAQACGACHQAPEQPTGVGTSGPDLTHIGRVAEGRVPGQSAAQYLMVSLVFPNAFLAPDYPANVMPLDYGQTLSLQARRDLVAYLLTLR